MTAPRPGSTIDRAQRALQSGPLPRAELARLIERDEDELDGLLRYGVRMGLLVRSNGDNDVTYALGTGEPVELEARPAPPAPAPNEYTARRGSQHVLKAEAARPDATDRDTPAIISPVGGPMGAGQAAAAAPQPGNYRPQPGSQAEMLLAYLQRHAPHGGEVWLSAPELGASGARKYTVHASLQTAIRCGMVLAKGSPQRYQAGPAAPAVLGVVPTTSAAPAALAPAPDPAPAADVAAFFLKQFDGEIERLEFSLRIVRRRREEFAAAVKGMGRITPPQGRVGLAPPQFGQGTAAASVRATTERA